MPLTRRTARLSLNQFDDRLVPAVLVPAITLDGHQMWVHGTDLNDKINVAEVKVNGVQHIRVDVKTQNPVSLKYELRATGDFLASRVNSMRLEGLGGDDLIVNDTAKPSTIFGGKGNDTLYGGSADDTIYGNEGDDCLYGRAGNDHLYGGLGNDHVYGGAGNDVLAAAYDDYRDWLQGDGGNDTFIFRSRLINGQVKYQAENVVDFTVGHDKIHIDGVTTGTDDWMN